MSGQAAAHVVASTITRPAGHRRKTRVSTVDRAPGRAVAGPSQRRCATLEPARSGRHAGVAGRRVVSHPCPRLPVMHRAAKAAVRGVEGAPWRRFCSPGPREPCY